MPTYSRLALIALGLAAGLVPRSPAADDEPKVDLRGPAPKIGQVFRSTSKFQYKDADVTVRANGERVTGKMSMVGSEESESKILAVNGREVTRYRTKNIKDETTFSMTVQGETVSNDDIGELAGEIVVSEKTAEKWKHTLTDAKPTADQQKALDDLAGWDDEDYIPEGRHPIGKTWEVDATHLKRLFGGGITSVSGKVTATFVRLEKYGGELCAVVEETGRVKGKMRMDDGEVTMDIDMKSVSHRSVRSGVALREVGGGEMKVTFKKNESGVEVVFEAKGKFTVEIASTLQD